MSEINISSKVSQDLIAEEISENYNITDSLIADIEDIVGGGGEILKGYGVRIDKNNSDPYTRCEYILNAKGMTPAYMDFENDVFNYGSWGDVWFVRDNYPCMLKSDGTVDYKLNPNDYTKKADGTASNVTNLSYNGNAMSAIPLCYLYLYEDSTYHYFIVSDVQENENYKAYAHTNSNGVVLNEIFLAIYEGYVSSNKLRSISTNQEPTGNTTMEQEMTYAQANGTGWDIRSWTQRTLINVLLTIMSKSTDGQTKFGRGNSDNSSVSYIKNGKGNTYGQFWGTSSGTSSNAILKTFHMENWWGNKYERLTGLLVGGNTGAGLKIKMTPPYNRTGDGYTRILTDHTTAMTSNIWLKDVIVNEYGVFKNSDASGGSASTYWCDYGYWKYDYYSSSSVCAPLVGCYSSSTAGYAGPWYVSLGNTVDSSYSHRRACLSFVSA